MTSPVEPMLPDQIVLEGFLEQYDIDRYPDVQSLAYMKRCHVVPDPDLPAPVQLFTRDGHIEVVRLFFDGYFIAPMKHMVMNPATVFDVLVCLIEMEPTAPRRSRVKFWMVKRLLTLAARILAS